MNGNFKTLPAPIISPAIQTSLAVGAGGEKEVSMNFLCL